MGCESCIAPSKKLFLEVEGVRSARVLGSFVEIVYDESKTTLHHILAKVGKYYLIEVVEEGAF